MQRRERKHKHGSDRIAYIGCLMWDNIHYDTAKYMLSTIRGHRQKYLANAVTVDK
jgi:hypothetical protein